MRHPERLQPIAQRQQVGRHRAKRLGHDLAAAVLRTRAVATTVA